MTDTNADAETHQMQAATSPCEWKELREGARRVLVGTLTYADQEMIQLASGDGGAFNIAISPAMMFQMDMLMNSRFVHGVRRAIAAKATGAGWVTDVAGVLEDVPGHGCPPQMF